jgi:hypothetical protein
MTLVLEYVKALDFILTCPQNSSVAVIVEAHY